MASGLDAEKKFFRRCDALALSALSVKELTAAAPEHHGGVMVALVPDDPGAFVLEHAEALPEDDLHITLCYLGKVQDLTSFDQNKILADTRRVCDEIGHAFTTSSDGVVVMGSNDDGVPATALLVQADDIVALYDALAEALNYESTYPSFIPHMTMGYGVPIEDAQERVGQQISFSNVLVKFGDARHAIPLTSTITAADSGANVGDHAWMEGLHPRGGDGEFIEKTGSVSGKVSITKPDGSTTIVDANRSPVVGFKTIDGVAWVLVEILNEDGTTSQGTAKATDVKSVAQVKARLDDPNFVERVSAIREDVSVPDSVPAAAVP